MKTLTQLFEEMETEVDFRTLIDGRSGVNIVDENKVPDSPDDYEVLREYDFEDQKFAAVRGPSGEVDAIDFVDGCRLYRNEIDNAAGLILWVRECHQDCGRRKQG